MKSLAEIPREKIKLLSFNQLTIKVLLTDGTEIEFNYETAEQLNEALQKLAEGFKPRKNPD